MIEINQELVNQNTISKTTLQQKIKKYEEDIRKYRGAIIDTEDRIVKKNNYLVLEREIEEREEDKAEQ